MSSRSVKREADTPEAPDPPPQRRMKRSSSQEPRDAFPDDPDAMDVGYTEEETEHIHFLINHLTLPPKLPTEPEQTRPQGEHALINFVMNRAEEFVAYLDFESDECNAWDVVAKMLRSMKRVHALPSPLHHERLARAILDMAVGDVLPLHIQQQNSGVILRRKDVSTLTFEYFQASPRGGIVASNAGKLSTQFPLHPRASFPFIRACIFQLASVLDTLNGLTLNDARPTYEKKPTHNTREVNEIQYISEMLRGIAVGLTENHAAVANSTQYVSKRLNDHVVGTGDPWRRSPKWLIIRVALQTTLKECGISETSPYGYKNFVTYILSRLLDAAQRSYVVGRDLLHVIRVKVAYRVHKIPVEEQNELFPFSFFGQALESTEHFLQQKWREAQEQDTAEIPWTPPTVEAIEASLHFPLPNSKEALKHVQSRFHNLLRTTTPFDVVTFEAEKVEQKPKRDYCQSPPQPLDLMTKNDRDLWLAIVDVEGWIENDRLEDWFEETEPQRRVVILANFIRQFRSLAIRYSVFREPAESANPERFSRLVLTMLDFWVALDKTVVEITPLLAEYPTEFQLGWFLPLLLPTKLQLERLSKIEQYILARESNAEYRSMTMFAIKASKSSFHCRYFSQSQKHQILERKIEVAVREGYEVKKDQMAKANADYYELIDRANGMECTMDGEFHRPSCAKCRLEATARMMSIEVFEFPLPDDGPQRKAVIVELDFPSHLSQWREETYDIARTWSPDPGQSDEGRISRMLSSYAGLSEYWKSPSSHISIGARSKKSFFGTRTGLPCDDNAVFKAHPFHYTMKHTIRNEWLTEGLPTPELRKHCTPRLPWDSPYANLAWTLQETWHTPNEVIARQSECHHKISIHDFLAFGHLRAGHRIQWRNVMRELLACSGLRDPAFWLLVRQAIWQVEVSDEGDDVFREAHADFRWEPQGFARQVVRMLREKLEQVEDNWQEAWTVGILNLLACRIVSLVTPATPQQDGEDIAGEGESLDGRQMALDFVVQSRDVMMKYLDSILSQIRIASIQPQAKTGAVQNQLAKRVVQIAANCRTSFAFDAETLSVVLKEGKDALFQFLRCSFIVQTYCRSSYEGLDVPLRDIVAADAVLSAETLDVVMQVVLDRPAEVNRAVASVWEGFVPSGQGWRRLEGSDRWVASRTTASRGGVSRWVHDNVLDGTILVDGKAFDNLPLEIIRHTFFQEIFPKQEFMDVVPSTMGGMDYELARKMNGIEVHFLYRNSELIIRTRDADKRTCELVPIARLRDDIPNNLLFNTFLVYRDHEKVLDFCPSSGPSKLWDPTAVSEYRLHLSGQSIQQLQKMDSHREDVEWMLSPQSVVVQTFSRVFQPLEASPQNLLVAWASTRQSALNKYDGHELMVRLPRYRLAFTVDSQGQLASRELSDAILATAQVDRLKVGTLIGLENKLVLCKAASASVIIPIISSGPEAFKATTTYGHSAHATTVTIIIPPEVQHVRSVILDVDHLLNRLISRDGTLITWYWLDYLHILTSSTLPDPLTQVTGLQQALTMLRSAASFSFMSLDNEHRVLLKKIDEVSPQRSFFPPHFTSAEIIKWNPNLPVLVQDDRIAPLCDEIIKCATKLLLFNPPKQMPKIAQRGPILLRERAVFRNGRYIQDLSGKDPRFPDVFYYMSPTSGLHHETVSGIAKAVKERQHPPHICNDLWHLFFDWSHNRTLSTRKQDEFSSSPFRFLLIQEPALMWFSLFGEVQSALNSDKALYKLAFLLGVAAYRSSFGSALAGTLLTISLSWNTIMNNACKFLSHHDDLNLQLGHSEKHLERNLPKLIERHIIPLWNSRQHQEMIQRQNESDYHYKKRKQEAYVSDYSHQIGVLVRFILPQWPSHTLSWQHFPANLDLIDLVHCEQAIDSYYASVFRNHRLHSHAQALSEAIRQHRQSAITIDFSAMFLPPPPRAPQLARCIMPSLLSLMQNRQAPVRIKLAEDVSMLEEREERMDVTELSHLVATFRSNESSGSGIRNLYAAKVDRSIQALETRRIPIPSHQLSAQLPSPDTFRASLNPVTVSDFMLRSASIWPVASNGELLRQLAWNNRSHLSESWMVPMLSFTELLIAEQRNVRLARLSVPGLEVDYRKELENTGGVGWNSAEYPDWLLIQLDADMLIRPVQAAVAAETMHPENGDNSLGILNMGEGKTSLIMPIVSAILADGNQLVRPVVLKPLASQTFEILRQRLSGLTNHRIAFFPFNREVPINASNVHEFSALYQTCASARGVVVTLPEHILSLHLMTVHASLLNSSVMQPLIELQRWLDDHARDILDESDALLQPRYQLIWTKGLPRALNALNTRSIVLPEIACLLAKKAADAAKNDPDAFEIGDAGEDDRFPRLRLLSPSKAMQLLQEVAHDIVFDDALMSTISFRRYPRNEQQMAVQFITQADASKADCKVVKERAGGTFEHLLLLRGLFSHGILLHCFMDKRWRVDYGLHRCRTRLAVPYRAKDQPALRAEFGHPDVMLLKSLLSYYYEGLTDSELEICFELLFKSDNPALRYEDWVRAIAHNLPPSLRTLRGLNLEDKDQKLNHIFPKLRKNRNVVTFYITQSVFARDAKEFPYKLSTNAWDLARRKTQAVTGFSGTQDNSYVLPLSIRQADSAGRQHTTALVLNHILDPRNRRVICTPLEDATALLRRVTELETPASVLLDVGAQVLELQNKDVARVWLQLDSRPHIEAAVFFDTEKDEPYVLHREGDVELLASSLYKSQLDKALVYLDEAHTRGTDFKFPSGSVAVVTLGPKLTKDKLVQGCMRMRRLADGHSVVFFANPEVTNKIRGASRKPRETELNSRDVLLWTMGETCSQIQDDMPLWKSQGLNFDKRDSVWQPHKQGYLVDHTLLLDAMQEREGHTVEELYGIRYQRQEGQELTQRQREIYEKCRQFGVLETSLGTSATEEQELELAHEREEERQIERAPPAQPNPHKLDDKIKQFVRDGKSCKSFMPLYESLKRTTGLVMMPQKSLFRSNKIVVTEDFYRTVKFPAGQSLWTGMDDFLRDVTWILSSSETETIVLISPFEANELLPKVRESKVVFLHVYAPRVTRTMPKMDDLEFFCVPSRRPEEIGVVNSELRLELNLFAGQLFFSSPSACKNLSDTLGLFTDRVREDLKQSLDSTGFVRSEDARAQLPGLRERCAFNSSPVPFLRMLVSWRRKGQGFALTHLGKLLYGNKVEHVDFGLPSGGSSTHSNDVIDDGQPSSSGAASEVIDLSIDDEAEAGWCNIS